MRSTETRARRMEVRPRKNSVSEGCEQCLAKGGNEISFCGNTVFLKSPAWEHNPAVQAGGAVAASHPHINTDFSFLFSSETEIDTFCVGLDWKKKKKRVPWSKLPLSLNSLSSPGMDFISREPFYSYTYLQTHTRCLTIRKIFIFTRQQAVLVAMAFVSIIFTI